MSFYRPSFSVQSLALVTLFSLVGIATATDLSQTPLSTYGTSATDVKPNVLFVLDDSGSMDWDYMPDWACYTNCSNAGQNPLSTRSEYLFRSAAYNGVYYNPAVQYAPPIAVGSTGATSTSTYPSQTGATTAQGADSSTKPNWNAVKVDAYGVQSTSTASIASSAIFYTLIAGEYCTSNTLKTCTTASAPTGTYTYPAPVRWCNSSALTDCQAAFSPTYGYVRAPSPRTTTITFSTVSGSASITDITVGSYKILPSTVTANSTTAMATAVAAGINACNGLATGACTAAGFAATVSGSTVTITAGAVATLGTPTLSKTGTVSWNTISAFSTSAVPGYAVLSVIVPGTTAAYAYPGSNSKASTRSDCSATTSGSPSYPVCTGNEEMTNYANWYTYYRTRMQMMKTAASNAFAAIDSAADIAAGKSGYRLGYMTINNNTGTDFVNLAEFTGTQKYNWYSKLLKADPGNSTPLRQALSTAGRLYAGKFNGSSVNGVTVTEPLQYSCQRNYTILSTDGFWNGTAGTKLDGSTAVGNQDGGDPKPYGDGGSTTVQIRTSKLQVSTAPPINQYRNNTLQVSTFGNVTAPSIQQRTSSNRGNSWSGWQDVSSCTPVTSGRNRVDCQYPISTSSNSGATWSSWTYASSCTAVTTGTNRTACSGSVLTWSTPVNATASCTQYSGTAVVGSKNCTYLQGTWTNTTNNASCVQVPAGSGPTYSVLTSVDCQQLPGTFGTYVDASGTCTTSSTTRCQYTAWSAWGTVSSCSAVAQSSASPYTQLVASQCQTISSGGNSDNLADVAAYYYKTDLRTATPATTADTTGTCSTSGGTDLCKNNVPAGGKRDEAAWQHMTTFTLGLGAQGQMIYAPDPKTGDYWTDTSGDFYSIYNGVTASSANVAAGICSWMSSGQCVWPTPSSNSNANIDDLWHAAVNGHGTYFSAKDPASLTNSLTSTLASIPANNRTGTSAAAASSNPNVTSTDNFIFSSSYLSTYWTGELTRRLIKEDGTLTDVNWYAARLLDCSTTVWAANKAYSRKAAFRYTDTSVTPNTTYCYVVKNDYTSGNAFDSGPTGMEGLNTAIVNEDETAATKTPIVPATTRTIYTNSSTALIDFSLTALTSASLNNSFTESFLKSNVSQFCTSGTGCISSTSAASGQTFIDYLRGVRTNEGVYYRKRLNVLGDIVSAEARYVKTPLQNYTDTGFSTYKADQLNRKGVVYVAANDGMLHAFDASNGKELWAYIPSKLLPNLYKLADNNYSLNHQYYVDGTPEVSEVYGPCRTGISGCSGNEWHTILVGGLNGGGKSYYALDITDPADPRFLWEVTDSTMGYTYGSPKITKLKDGTWVVLLTSGYNNSDGKGYMYIRNALTGTSIRTIATNTVGEIGRFNSRALSPDTDNTSIAAYAGDTAGNLWRFDINGDIPGTTAGYDAQKLISFADANGKAQPITAKPDISTVNGLTMVYVGTGRYLGVTDISNTDYQSFYGVIDRSDATTLTTPRATGSKFVKQTLTDGTCPANAPASLCAPSQVVRTSTSNAVDWTNNNGWYLDFLGAGERSATDPTLALGTVLFTTISPSLPTADPCNADGTTASGKSFLYALNYINGGAVTGSQGVVAFSLGNMIATRPVPIELPSGVIGTLTQGTPPKGVEDVITNVSTPPIAPSTSYGVRRMSWREITSQ